MHDLCVLRDEGGLADVFAARVTSRKVTVALDAYAAGAAGAPAAAGAPSAAGTTGGAGTSINNRTGWLNVGGGPARTGLLGLHSPPVTRASVASAASAASAGGTAAKRPSLRRTLSSPAEKARLLLAEVRRIYMYI